MYFWSFGKFRYASYFLTDRKYSALALNIKFHWNRIHISNPKQSSIALIQTHTFIPPPPHLQFLSLYRPLPPTISPHKLNKTAYARDSVQYSMAITLQEKDSSVTGTNTADVWTHNIRLIYGECFHRDTYGWRPPKMQYSRVAVRPAVIHLHSLTTSISEHTNAHGKFMNQ